MASQILLNLTARQQTILAELMPTLRRVIYCWLTSKPVDNDALATEISDWADRYGISPQELDQLYDKLHRTGANT